MISFPLHADSTLQALTDLPRSSSELADAIAVVYYSSASARDELRRNYAGSLDKLVYVRRTRIYDALLCLKGNNVLYKDINISAANLASLPDNDVPETVWTTSFARVEQDATLTANREGDVLYSYVRSRRAAVPRARTTEIHVPGSQGASPAPQFSDRVDDPEGSRYDVSGGIGDNNGLGDLGTVASGIVDLNGTGVAARHVQSHVFRRFHTLRPGVGSKPVSEFDNTGVLLAKAFPVLFPYGVGAPGMLASLPKGSESDFMSTRPC